MTPYFYPPNTSPYADPTGAILTSILLQIGQIQAKGRKPAIIKLHADTDKAIQEYMKCITVEDKTRAGRHELYGLQVVVDPCMKPGTARVFMEWE